MKTIESELGTSECYKTEILPAIAQLNWILSLIYSPNLYSFIYLKILIKNYYNNEKLFVLLSLVASKGATVNFL